MTQETELAKALQQRERDEQQAMREVTRRAVLEEKLQDEAARRLARERKLSAALAQRVAQQAQTEERVTLRQAAQKEYAVLSVQRKATPVTRHRNSLPALAAVLLVVAAGAGGYYAARQMPVAQVAQVSHRTPSVAATASATPRPDAGPRLDVSLPPVLRMDPELPPDTVR